MSCGYQKPFFQAQKYVGRGPQSDPLSYCFGISPKGYIPISCLESWSVARIQPKSRKKLEMDRELKKHFGDHNIKR